MNKIIIAGLLILLVRGNLAAQHPFRGVLLKRTDPFRPGDTIEIYGYRDKPGGEACLVRSGSADKYVPANKIRLPDEEMGYWQKVWLMNQSSHVHSNGWQNELRIALREDFYEYASQMEINGLVFRDEYLEDYLKQLIYIIHPQALKLINTAIAMNDFDFVEALAEKGLILIRLGEVDQARAVFEEYMSAVSEMPEMPPGRDATWANRMLIKCDQLMLRR